MATIKKSNTVASVSAADVAEWKVKEDGRKGYSVAIGGKRKFYQVGGDGFTNKKEALAAIQEALDAANPKAKADAKPAPKNSGKDAKPAPKADGKKDTKPKAKESKGQYETFTVAAGLFKQSVGDSDGRWLVRVKDESGEPVRGSFSIKKLGADEAFIDACNFYLEAKGEIAFKVESDELPVAYATLLKKCKASKKELYFK